MSKTAGLMFEFLVCYLYYRFRCVHVEVMDEEKNLYKQEQDKIKASEQQRKLQVLFSEDAGQNHGEREKALEEELR